MCYLNEYEGYEGQTCKDEWPDNRQYWCPECQGDAICGAEYQLEGDR